MLFDVSLPVCYMVPAGRSEVVGVVFADAR
jgi:hypothetical protein